MCDGPCESTTVVPDVVLGKPAPILWAQQKNCRKAGSREKVQAQSTEDSCNTPATINRETDNTTGDPRIPLLLCEHCPASGSTGADRAALTTGVSGQNTTRFPGSQRSVNTHVRMSERCSAGTNSNCALLSPVSSLVQLFHTSQKWCSRACVSSVCPSEVLCLQLCSSSFSVHPPTLAAKKCQL